MNSISNWFACNELTIKNLKCETKSIGSGKPPMLNLANNNMPYITYWKYLRVYLNPKLNFREEMSYIAKKINKVCGLMHRVSYMYLMKCLQSFYKPYAKFIINYGLLVYGKSFDYNSKILDQAQRRVIKTISFKSKSDSLNIVYK